MNGRFITHFKNNEATRSQSVLLELMTILGKYRKDLYLVGGWAPYFLLQLFQRPEDDFKHAGSIDIDIVPDGSQQSCPIKMANLKFATPNATGPSWAATFMMPNDPMGIKVLQAEIYKSVQPFVEGIGREL